MAAARLQELQESRRTRTKRNGSESRDVSGERCRNFVYDFWRMLRFLTAGESHGRALVVILEGLPAGLRIDLDAVNRELRRRQGGYGR